ncbi:cupin domain-containing protein [uncultured Tateyamaria sp.]|uniref:cupin domain-containing protein n=1 Tax=Tateyamaria sp. 1078 TaxID=3417464 RepID=UPI002609E49B|nr:cupin domain-containing protein [uncultured Tateyamaria sp.]
MTVVRRGTARIDAGGAGSAQGPYRAELISDTAGLTQFGAFIEELPPGSRSSFSHWHATEDEMVLILDGTLTENGVETILSPGDAACWRAGDPVAHSMYNHADTVVRYVVIGTRVTHDTVTYPDHDRVLRYDRTTNTRRYTTLDGQPADKPG